MKRNRLSTILVILSLSIGIFYGAGRLWYHYTDGFLLENISSEFAYDTRWETRPLTGKERIFINQILQQDFYYLSKGCQSYVFESEDGQYVIKFFKYHRFRNKPWIEYFSFIPAVERHRLRRLDHKTRKRERLFQSCKVAFDHVQKETGLIYVHLNKTSHLNHKLKIVDKVGMNHFVDLDKMEFIIQKKAEMLCPKINHLVAIGNEKQAEEVINNLLDMILYEYERGLCDNDPALMQNTGVYQEMPMHVDVGQFVVEPTVKDPDTYLPMLVNKLYKFRHWLKNEHPQLADKLDNRLSHRYGKAFFSLKSQYE